MTMHSISSVFTSTPTSHLETGKYAKGHRDNPIRLLIFLKVSHCVSS